ncbi:tetratricopeptide repeat protein [Candidatus Riflebacteria bacterium]
MVDDKKKKLDINLLWQKVNIILNPEILEISQKVHFFSDEIMKFEAKEEIRPDEIGIDELRLGLSESYSDLGIALMKIKRLDLAHISFLYAIELDVRNFIAFYQMGILAKNAKNYTFAIRSFKLALDINCNFFAAQLKLSNCLEEIEEWEQALESYKSIPENDDNYPVSQLSLMRLFVKTGQREKAKILFEGHKANSRLIDLYEEMQKIIDL